MTHKTHMTYRAYKTYMTYKTYKPYKTYKAPISPTFTISPSISQNRGRLLGRSLRVRRRVL